MEALAKLRQGWLLEWLGQHLQQGIADQGQIGQQLGVARASRPRPSRRRATQGCDFPPRPSARVSTPAIVAAEGRAPARSRGRSEIRWSSGRSA